MHISKIYPKIKKDIIIRGITNKINDVRKNYIYVSNKDDSLSSLNTAIKNGACVIITEKNISLDAIVIKVNNCEKELDRILKIFYHYVPTINTIGISTDNSSNIICLFLNNIFSQIGNVGLIYNNKINYLNYQLSIENDNNSQIYQTIQHMNYKKINDCIIDTKNCKKMPYLNCIIASRSNLDNKFFHSQINLIKKLGKNSLLIYNKDEKKIKDLYLFNKGYSVSYGIENGDYHVEDYIINLDGSIFNVYHQNRLLSVFKTNLFGIENIYNALAAITYANELGIPINIISNGIRTLENDIIKKNKLGITEIVCNYNNHISFNNFLADLNRIKKNKIILIISLFEIDSPSLFGKIASEYAKTLIFTFNDINKLLYEFTKKIDYSFDYYIAIDEKKALDLALKLAKEGDFIITLKSDNSSII